VGSPPIKTRLSLRVDVVDSVLWMQLARSLAARENGTATHSNWWKPSARSRSLSDISALSAPPARTVVAEATLLRRERTSPFQSTRDRTALHRDRPAQHHDGLTPPQPLALLGLRPTLLIPRTTPRAHERARQRAPRSTWPGARAGASEAQRASKRTAKPWAAEVARPGEG